MNEQDVTELTDEELKKAFEEELQKLIPRADQPLRPSEDTIEPRLASSPKLKALLAEMKARGTTPDEW